MLSTLHRPCVKILYVFTVFLFANYQTCFPISIFRLVKRHMELSGQKKVCNNKDHCWRQKTECGVGALRLPSSVARQGTVDVLSAALQLNMWNLIIKLF